MIAGRTPATSKTTKKKGSDASHTNERVISQNRKARHNYTVLDTLECGLVLVGSEVKSLRNGQVSLEEAYARVKDDEVWLIGCDIAEYTEANRFNHNPRRPRKLLMHRREVKHFAHRAFEKGLTLVPLEMHFKQRAGQSGARHLPRQTAARQARGHEEGRGPARHGPANAPATVDCLTPSPSPDRRVPQPRAAEAPATVAIFALSCSIEATPTLAAEIGSPST